MKIEKNTLDKIKKSFSVAPIESGGMIGSRAADSSRAAVDSHDEVISAFCFDHGGDPEEYVPNVEMLNEKIGEWAKNGISFAGIVHSHHNDCRFLSDADIDYARAILKDTKLSSVCFPIVTYFNDEIIVTPYRIDREKVEKGSFLIIDD